MLPGRTSAATSSAWLLPASLADRSADDALIDQARQMLTKTFEQFRRGSNRVCPPESIERFAPEGVFVQIGWCNHVVGSRD
jgi:hypothetical protein